MVATPFLTKLFIDNIEFKQGDHFWMLAMILLFNFAIGQLLFYFADIFCGKSEKEIWNRIVENLSQAILNHDSRRYCD
ncbi:6TM ABC transporter family protein [Lapidilactobacillus bayanensis]|uniref:hypothetical protein n=1 Tax=Lapidilactobacillus bayanensis TaxID=2485998 RepID=UPI000F796223|nr:hypothetical protein [Lapidilactobacillus bayanensis]